MISRPTIYNLKPLHVGMFRISGIIVDKSGRDYSGNMENAHGLKTERNSMTNGKIKEIRPPASRSYISF